jgi:hypothetical protein
MSGDAERRIACNGVFQPETEEDPVITVTMVASHC